MVRLPQADTTVAAIYRAYEDAADDGHRHHLGASLIGAPCRRQLWYLFRWAATKRFEGRILRLFRRGHQEERTFNADLRAAGCQVIERDPKTGEQWNFSDIGGHFGGSCDGKVLGLVEAPKTEHILEEKTHSKKSFDDLEKKGVEKSKPQHYDQMQLYMHWSKLKRAYYLAVCKDDDRLYGERIKYDKDRAKALVERARSIIEAPQPLEKIHEDPSWWQCKFCDFRGICRDGDGANVNCRTCVHSTPETDTDNARWSCAYWDCDIPPSAQREGCEKHLLIPDLVSWAVQVDGNAEENWIEYRTENGHRFRNGGGGLTSREVSALDEYSYQEVQKDSLIVDLRAIGGEVIEYERSNLNQEEK